MKKLAILATAMAFTLSGCGGDDAYIAEDNTNTQPKAGDPLYVTTKVDGQEVIKETYKYYALNDSGRLVAEAKPEYDSAPHIAIMHSRKVTSMPVVYKNAMLVQANSLPEVNAALISAFTEDLIAALRAHYPNLSMHEIALQLGDFDQSIEDLHLEYEESGLSSVKEMVEFYETIDKHFPNHANAEGDADHFLDLCGLSIYQFINQIHASGVTWDALLTSMVKQNTSFHDLYNAYTASLKSLPVFIADFIQGKKASVALNYARPYGDPATDAAKVAVDAAKLGLDVAKFAWEIIKDARPKTTAEGAYTKVLSLKDTNYENYGYSTRGESAAIDYEGKNLFTMTLFHAKFKIDGYYRATDANAPGYWLPSIAFKVDESFAALTWNLNAGAAITSAANMASSSAPEPEIQIVANVQANGWFQSFTNSYTFYANGRSGFRKQ